MERESKCPDTKSNSTSSASLDIILSIKTARYEIICIPLNLVKVWKEASHSQDSLYFLFPFECTIFALLNKSLLVPQQNKTKKKGKKKFGKKETNLLKCE